MYLKNLVIIVSIAFILRLLVVGSQVNFGDMDWFFAAAYQALQTGHLPMLGITSSITWLHQGPLWTYFLLMPVPPIYITLILGLCAVILAHLTSGKWAGLLMAVLPLAVSQSITPYHTTLIPVFFFLVFACILRRHSYLTGLFVGFLYQSHLLTFIYWPLWIYLAYKKNLSIKRLALGFVLGILPFIIAGPIQTFGIFVWLVKQIVTGFSGVSGGLSTAYQVVLLPGIVFGIGQMLKWINAYRSSSRTQ